MLLIYYTKLYVTIGRLKNLCEQFTKKELSASVFLTNVGHNKRLKRD